MDGRDNGKMSKYDEPYPHWCDCTSDGKWKDSTLSSPISHDPINNYNPENEYCQCMGWRGYTEFAKITVSGYILGSNSEISNV